MPKYTREEVIKGVKEGRSFENDDLRGINLKGADLSGGKFKGANFRYTDLREAILRNADLRGANLRHVVLAGADLTNADLSNADLTHADLRGAVLVGTKLSGAKIDGAKGISNKVFFPEKTIERLAETGALELEGEILKVSGKDGIKKYEVERAYRFVGVEGGNDSLKLIGKVKTKSEILKMNAEIYQDNILISDVVYKAEPGFLGTPVGEGEKEAKEEKAQPLPEDIKLLSDLILKGK
jgi:uncharacterized protein YjbI with pentapeptide repeats